MRDGVPYLVLTDLNPIDIAGSWQRTPPHGLAERRTDACAGRPTGGSRRILDSTSPGGLHTLNGNDVHTSREPQQGTALTQFLVMTGGRAGALRGGGHSMARTWRWKLWPPGIIVKALTQPAIPSGHGARVFERIDGAKCDR